MTTRLLGGASFSSRVFTLAALVLTLGFIGTIAAPSVAYAADDEVFDVSYSDIVMTFHTNTSFSYNSDTLYSDDSKNYQPISTPHGYYLLNFTAQSENDVRVRSTATSVVVDNGTNQCFTWSNTNYSRTVNFPFTFTIMFTCDNVVEDANFVFRFLWESQIYDGPYEHEGSLFWAGVASHWGDIPQRVAPEDLSKPDAELPKTSASDPGDPAVIAAPPTGGGDGGGDGSSEDCSVDLGLEFLTKITCELVTQVRNIPERMAELFVPDQQKFAQTQFKMAMLYNKVPFAYAAQMYVFMQQLLSSSNDDSPASMPGIGGEHCIMRNTVCSGYWGVWIKLPKIGDVPVLPSEASRPEIYDVARSYRPIVIWASYIVIAFTIGSYVVANTMPRFTRDG